LNNAGKSNTIISQGSQGATADKGENMSATTREQVEEEIEKSDKSLAVLSIYAKGYKLDLANWKSFAEDAEDNYLGHYTNRTAFAEDYAERLGLLNGNNGEGRVLVKYFNYDYWAHDLFKNGIVWEYNGHHFQA
jgi:antirestriction protein